jgi:rsbT antagonist protein RsbS
MAVPVLRQGRILIATAQSALTDADWKQLETTLAAEVGNVRAEGVVLDVTALDVLDSFAVRTLRTIARVTRLRGAETVLVGIQPDVAISMAQLGLSNRLDDVETSLDLDDALSMLTERLERRRRRSPEEEDEAE